MASSNITLALGLVTVTCKSEVATVSKTSLAYLCTGQPGHAEHPASPRRAPYVCETCGPITDDKALKRGVKSGKTYTIVDAEAATEAKESYAGQYKGTLKLVGHKASDFLAKTGQGDSTHYLTPADATQAEGYAILAALIERHPEVAFTGLYTPSTATALFHLTARDGVIVMLKRTREQSLKPMPAAPSEVNETYYAMLDGLLDGFTEDYDPATYEDAYANTLTDLVAQGDTVALDADATAVGSGDLLAALTALQAEAKKPAPRKRTTKKKVAAA